MRREGWTYAAIGRELGVTNSAVRYACDEEARQKMWATRTEAQRSGVCPDCGAQSTIRYVNGVRRVSRCRDCDAKRHTKVRDGTAYCPACDAWKPLEAFGRSDKHPQRGVRGECRACETARRREYRQRMRAAS